MPAEIPATDSSLVDVLERFADRGWATNHTARPGAVMKCGNCARETPAEGLDVDALHRIEGASDPDDMQLVLGITCPRCSSRGAVAVAYGPAATDVDAEFVLGLDLDGRDDPVAIDPDPDPGD